jgi:hypothetical protein
MPISLPFLAELLAATAATALLIHAANKALRYFIDRAPTSPEYDVKFDVDPLAPESFVDAVPTPQVKDNEIPPRCHRCGSAMVISPRSICWMCDCSSSSGKDAA